MVVLQIISSGAEDIQKLDHLKTDLQKVGYSNHFGNLIVYTVHGQKITFDKLLKLLPENRQLLSQSSRALELTVSIHHHPGSSLSASGNVLPCRSWHHNPANPSQQVNRRSDR